jgi:putative ABC transport system ATP-binding protein
MEKTEISAPPLSVSDITKVFHQGTTEVRALDGVSLTVERGEFVAVMGASGSGKSTLLHCMAGLTRPATGRVLIDGEDLSGMSDRQLTLFRRRRVGLVFQAFNLIPALTAEENILLPILSDGAHLPDGRLEGLLERLKLTSRRHHRPDALSGGEQQRVAIARALVTDPAIILADEPTGSLDSISGQQLCRLLRELCEEGGRTLVVVSHEPAVAIWAKRVVVLKDGQVLTCFDTSEFHGADALAAHYHSVVNAAGVAEQPA